MANKSKNSPANSKTTTADSSKISGLFAKIDKKKIRAFLAEWTWAITIAVIGLALIFATLAANCESCQNCGACKTPVAEHETDVSFTDAQLSASDVSGADTTADTVSTTATTTTTTTAATSPASDIPSGEPYTNAADGAQLAPPSDGEQIAVIETSMGTIKLRLFPEQAPLACQNFISLANSGYYNGLIFHRVINDFMIQGGDPTGTGTGGDSCWGKDFAIESGRNLYNFRGALCMANTGMPNSNNSQFYIVQKKSIDGLTANDLASNGWPQWAADQYAKVGGSYWLDAENGASYTVFGQTFEGFDVIDAIAAVPTSQEQATKDKPLTDITINKVYMEVYKAA